MTTSHIQGDRKRKFFLDRLPSMDSQGTDVDFDDLDLNTGLELLETYNRDAEFLPKEDAKTEEEVLVTDTVQGPSYVDFEHEQRACHETVEEKPFTFQMQAAGTSSSDAGEGCSSVTYLDLDPDENSSHEDMIEDEVDFQEDKMDTAAKAKRYIPYRRGKGSYERGKQSASGITRIKSSSSVRTPYYESVGESSEASSHSSTLQITEKKESFDVHCEACRALHSHNNLVECLHPHFICKQCVEKSAKSVLVGEGKGDIDCPVKDCNKSVPQSELRKALPSIVMDLLEECWKKYALDIIKTMEDAVTCPGCGIIGLTDPKSKMLNCLNCLKKYCHLCGMEWYKKSHDLCYAMKTGVSMETGKNSTIPLHWSDAKEVQGRGFVEVEVEQNSTEFNEVASLFLASMAAFEVKKIYRVQNKRLWEKYSLFRSHMVADLGLKDINECRLFHGTSPDVIMAICKEGFDWRMSGKNGEQYGIGTYFARNASYSDRYVRKKHHGHSQTAVSTGGFAFPYPGQGCTFSPSNVQTHQQFPIQSNQSPFTLPGPALPGATAGSISWVNSPSSASSSNTSNSDNVDLSHIDGNLMFVGRVLVGRSCVGNPKMRRPGKDFFNDQCHTAVDNTATPFIYVVFDMAQCYPEYIIQYGKIGGN